MPGDQRASDPIRVRPEHVHCGHDTMVIGGHGVTVHVDLLDFVEHAPWPVLLTLANIYRDMEDEKRKAAMAQQRAENDTINDKWRHLKDNDGRINR